MTDDPFATESLPPAAAQRVDEVCDRFETAWKAARQTGRRPRIEDYLPQVPEAKLSLLRELILLEIHYRRLAGEQPRPEEYQGHFPALDPTWLAAVLGSAGEKPAGALPELTETANERMQAQNADAMPCGTRVRCPHCQNPIQLSDAGSDEVLCPACGSTFRVHDTRMTSTTSGMRQLGKFQLLERVGLGAFGAVWRARDTELDRLVALKIPHASLLTAPADLERFYREARAAAQLRHPGIVTVHEVATLDGLPAIVADFIEGVTLRDFLQARRLTFRESAALMVQVARALDYAHEMGLVHRDIKPANIMLELPSSRAKPPTREGPTSLASDSASSLPDAAPTRPRPLLMDFGLALRDTAEITLTVDGQIIGTPAYMSPEQAAGQGHRVDRRSDLYSLGVILYEMLCGELPFRGSKAMIVYQVLHEEPRRPRRVNDKVPRDLETICLKCLRKEPAKRYANARAVAEDLQRFLEGRPIGARPTGRVERAWRWGRRNPVLAAISGLAVAALGATTVVSILLVVREKQNSWDLKQALKASEESRHNAEYRLAEDYFHRGITSCQQGKHGIGMLWLARSLELAPDDAGDFRRAARINLAAWRQELRPLRAAILQHRASIQAAVYSPDGKTVLTGSLDSTARLWEAATGKALGPALEHNNYIRAVAYSPDSQLVLTGSDDGDARLWRVATGKALGTALSHTGPVLAVAFSPDGKTVLTGSEDHTAQLWETATSKRLGPVLTHRGKVIRVAFSPDGRTLLTASADGTAQLWEAPTGKRLTSLKHDGSVTAIAFSPDGKTILTAGEDKTARLWETATGRLVGQPLRHRDEVEVVAFSPDGKAVLTGSDDNNARLWDISTGKLRSELLHDDSVLALAFHPDGRTFVTAAADGAIRIWDAATSAPLGRAFWHQGAVRALVFSPDGKMLLTASADSTARLWDASPLVSQVRTLRHEGAVLALAISADGRKLLTGTETGQGQLWNVPDGQPLGQPLAHKDVVKAVALDPHGQVALTGSWDFQARLWDATTGALLKPPLRHESWVVAVAFSPDRETILTGSMDHKVRLWKVSTGELLLPPLEHRGKVRSVAFSPDGKTILTGSEDQTACVWEAATGKLIREFRSHSGAVIRVAFSPDGKTSLTGSEDGTARLWKPETGEVVGRVMEHDGPVHALAFSPDGQLVLTGCEAQWACLWDAATGLPRSRPLMHQGAVRALTFSPDGRTALTGGSDSTARLWDVATGLPLGPPLRHDGSITDVAFSPLDGTTAFTASWDKTVRLWEVVPPWKADLDRIILWSEVASGMALDEYGTLRRLSAESWLSRQKHLQELGGPPLP